ncbi:transposase [Marinobacter segnicrescens]|uniref:transposase n=1 Tax=Marinobacter segnicrescens TaxID=430453 RepID=UPI003A938C68
MTRPREQLVSIADTPYYHVVSRCVRRTFLCGYDRDTGRNYEHRRQWIEDRIRILSSLFAIDICSYAVMSNHYHLVVKLSPEQAEEWSDDEVLARWSSLYKGPLIIQRYLEGESLASAERRFLESTVAVYRKRLTELSWFMKCLNEPIAREANREDDCTGHFWESRFKSQALLTEQAVLSCMAYVDLNPVRAAMAETPESSDHTSIKERLAPQIDLAQAVQSQLDSGYLRQFPVSLKPLLNFEGNERDGVQRGILFSLSDYLELVDYTGRITHPAKRGAIPAHTPPVLSRLGLTSDEWLQEACEFEARYARNQRAEQGRRRRAA